jgi:hypothetical protein
MKQILPTPERINIKDYAIGTMLWVKWSISESWNSVFACEELLWVQHSKTSDFSSPIFTPLGVLHSKDSRQSIVRGRFSASVLSVHEISKSDLYLFVNFKVTPEFNTLIKGEDIESHKLFVKEAEG